MNHCVPDCDEFGTDKGGESESVLKCSRRQDSTKLSENDFSELVWTTDGDLVMQVGGRSLQWFARQNEDRLAPSKPPSDRSKEGTLDAVVSSVVGTEQSISQSYADEDDLISWLQYPEDTLEKGNNCSDIFTPASTQLQFFKEPVIQAAVCEIPQKDSDREATMPRTEGLSVLPPPQTSESVISLSVGAIPQWSPSKKTDGGLASMLPPKPQKSNVVQSSNALNFSHFSRPAAIAKASLHTLGKCSTSITSHFQDQYKKSDVVTVTSNVEGSVESATTQSSIDVKETIRHQSSDKSLSHSSLKSCTSRDVKDNNPSTSAAAEANEQTLTSSSGGSGNSADRKCSSVVAGKRKSKDVEDSTECQSEDVEGESVDVKKTPPARSKRSRAAEVHNLSERRRRDRINEKMKALQELIPNSNKTDKASMLDEAIEYLKMLQLQLQMMSMRSGLSLPPMIIPAGMQMPQISTLPHVGMGMGVGMGLGMGIGMGMGMGLMDAASVRPVMPLPLAAGSGQPSNAPMPVNMEVYHAYMLQQQFQHQQMQLRHQHIQQQQHQHIQQQQQQQQTQPQTQTQQHQQQQKNIQ